MDTSIKANLFDDKFSISLTLDGIDFKSALIATGLMENLKETKLYGRVALKGYDTPVNESLFSTMLGNDYGDGYVYNFTGILITVHLPIECVSDEFYAGMDKDKQLRFYDYAFGDLLRFYNCFFENFMNHMVACNMPAFFRYNILKDVMPMKYEAHATIMIPTFDSVEGAFFDISRFSALEGVVTSAPRFDPLSGYEKTKTILEIPEGFHMESVALHPYTTDNNDKMDEWYVLVPNKKTEPESN